MVPGTQLSGGVLGCCFLPEGRDLLQEALHHSFCPSLKWSYWQNHIPESTSLPSFFFFLKQLYGGIINIP